MPGTTLILVRHGETDWNRDRRVQGQTDIPLNETGRLQARELAASLADLDLTAVYSSDLSRAYETATIVVGTRPLAIEVRRGLREKQFGSWEGLTDVEVATRFPEARNGSWGDGESSEALAGRVATTIAEIAERHPGGRVLVVTHGGPIRALQRGLGEEPGAIPNCSATSLLFEAGTLRRP